MYQNPDVEASSGLANSQASSLNYVNKNQWRVVIPACPILSQTITKCSVPRLSTGYAPQKAGYFDIPTVGDKLETGSFIITFPILSDLSNYLEVFTWMNTIVSDSLSSQNPKQVSRLQGVGAASSVIAGNDINNLYCDSTLIISDMSNNPTVNVTFLGMFPTDLSSIDFDSTDNSTEPVMATAKFEYIYHTILPAT